MPRVLRSVHYASRRSLVSLRIHRTSRVIRTLLSGLNCKSLRSFARITRIRSARVAGNRRLCGAPRCFLHTGRYFRTSTGNRMVDGLALSGISRCRSHKSTVDTAVARAYALTRSAREFGRAVSPRLVSPRLASPRSVSDRALRVGTYTCIESNLLSDYFDGAARP